MDPSSSHHPTRPKTPSPGHSNEDIRRAASSTSAAETRSAGDHTHAGAPKGKQTHLQPSPPLSRKSSAVSVGGAISGPTPIFGIPSSKPQPGITINTSIPSSPGTGSKHPSMNPPSPMRESPEDVNGSTSRLVPPPPPPSHTKPPSIALPDPRYHARADLAEPLRTPGLTQRAGSPPVNTPFIDPGPSNQGLRTVPSLPRPSRALSYGDRRGSSHRRSTITSLDGNMMTGVQSLNMSSASGMPNSGNGIGMGNGNGNGNANHGIPEEDHGKSQAVDWIVPLNGERAGPVLREKTVEERLEPTLNHAREELSKHMSTARNTGMILNIAIGAQVILGALTTGIAAATTGKHTQIATSILGGLSTLAASYLAKSRGSGEPEASIARCKDLEHFVHGIGAGLRQF
ncbi:hypothetical protein ABKN59_009388 [Abortiporus biennis]